MCKITCLLLILKQYYLFSEVSIILFNALRLLSQIGTVYPSKRTLVCKFACSCQPLNR
nr:MAG TPA: hypothetical protein [Caudoviricetes sp.]